jgi:hypothetical protein
MSGPLEAGGAVTCSMSSGTPSTEMEIVSVLAS